MAPSKLEITFGWHLDGPTFPDGPTAGTLALGPTGLLQQLALRLGLTCPMPHRSLRIAEFVALLRVMDDGKSFFSRSFQADAWATASAMLRLRDELVGAGWNPSQELSASERLKVLTALELQSQRQVSSPTDLMRWILRLLPCQTLPIRRVRLLDKRSMLPPIWRQLFLALEESSVSIEEERLQVSSVDTDLTRIASYVIDRTERELTGDGSFTIIESDDEIQAAEFTSALLKHQNWSGETVILRGGSTSFLDQMMRKRGLPALGAGLQSAQRSVLQMLPLFLQTLWKPFDPARLTEFLKLPQSPVPPFIASCFTRALRNQPGIHGPAWQEAWQNAEDRIRRVLEQDAIEPEEIDEALSARTRNYKRWLEPELFDPEAGIPALTAIAICHQIRSHLLKLSAVREETIFVKAAADAENCAQAISVQGNNFDISKRQLEQILDSVLGDGYRADSAEEASWSLVDHAGQICSHADTLIWWHFVAPEVSSLQQSHLWTPAEEQALSEIEIQLDSALAAIAREAISWRRPMLAAQKRLILIKPRTAAGRNLGAHPFNHEFAQTLENTTSAIRSKIIFQAHQIYQTSELRCADVVLPRKSLNTGTVLQERREWQIDYANLKRIPQSPTTLERLLACPLNWVLDSQASLRQSDLLSSAEGEQLSGNLAHAVFAQLFSNIDGSGGAGLIHNAGIGSGASTIHNAGIGSGASTIHNGISGSRTSISFESYIAEKAAAVFDDLCPRYAAPLLLPGKSLERLNLRKSVIEGAQHLYELITEAGFTHWQCEQSLASDYGSLSLSGRADMHLSHPQDSDFIVDLKWGRSSSSRKTELRKGQALQLAIYAALYARKTGKKTEGAYYMLAQKELLTSCEQPFGEHAHIEGAPLTHTFEKLVSTYDKHLEHLQAGTVYATGIHPAGSDDTKLVSRTDQRTIWWAPVPDVPWSGEPRCSFCRFSNICGKGK